MKTLLNSRTLAILVIFLAGITNAQEAVEPAMETAEEQVPDEATIAETEEEAEVIDPYDSLDCNLTDALAGAMVGMPFEELNLIRNHCAHQYSVAAARISGAGSLLASTDIITGQAQAELIAMEMMSRNLEAGGEIDTAMRRQEAIILDLERTIHDLGDDFPNEAAVLLAQLSQETEKFNRNRGRLQDAKKILSDAMRQYRKELPLHVVQLRMQALGELNAFLEGYVLSATATLEAVGVIKDQIISGDETE